ncbi:MAG: hypothetical protein RR549_04795 [Oscillospiraceae bacterium]
MDFDSFNRFIIQNTYIFSLIACVCIFIIAGGYFLLNFKNLTQKKAFLLNLIIFIITVVANISIFIQPDNLRYFEMVGINGVAIITVLSIIISIIYFIHLLIIYKKSKKEKDIDENISLKTLQKQCVISLMIFFIMTLINFIFNLLSI